MKVEFTCRGHENIRANHVKTIEFTKDTDISLRGDCIIGVAADFDPEELKKLSGKIRLTVRVEDLSDSFKAVINPHFDHDSEVVFRKSRWHSGRTLAFGLNRGSNRLDRRIVDRMRDPSTIMRVCIEETSIKGGRSKKIRADRLLVFKGLAKDQKEAAALILAGKVMAGDERIEKAGQLLPETTGFRIKGKEHPFVGRGGLKLAHALQFFSIDPAGCVCLDLGASTGGFTDVLIQNGASRVYAVESGYGQLSWKLCKDPRVVNLQRTDAFRIDRTIIPEPIDIVTADLSMMSLVSVLPVLLPLIRPGAAVILLIKPQYEANPEDVDSGWIVKKASVRMEACQKISNALTDLGFQIGGITESPIKGTKGNVEYLLFSRFPSKKLFRCGDSGFKDR